MNDFSNHILHELSRPLNSGEEVSQLLGLLDNEESRIMEKYQKQRVSGSCRCISQKLQSGRLKERKRERFLLQSFEMNENEYYRYREEEIEKMILTEKEDLLEMIVLLTRFLNEDFFLHVNEGRSKECMNRMKDVYFRVISFLFDFVLKKVKRKKREEVLAIHKEIQLLLFYSFCCFKSKEFLFSERRASLRSIIINIINTTLEEPHTPSSTSSSFELFDFCGPFFTILNPQLRHEENHPQSRQNRGHRSHRSHRRRHRSRRRKKSAPFFFIQSRQDFIDLANFALSALRDPLPAIQKQQILCQLEEQVRSAWSAWGRTSLALHHFYFCALFLGVCDGCFFDLVCSFVSDEDSFLRCFVLGQECSDWGVCVGHYCVHFCGVVGVLEENFVNACLVEFLSELLFSCFVRKLIVVEGEYEEDDAFFLCLFVLVDMFVQEKERRRGRRGFSTFEVFLMKFFCRTFVVHFCPLGHFLPFFPQERMAPKDAFLHKKKVHFLLTHNDTSPNAFPFPPFWGSPRHQHHYKAQRPRNVLERAKRAREQTQNLASILRTHPWDWEWILQAVFTYMGCWHTHQKEIRAKLRNRLKREPNTKDAQRLKQRLDNNKKLVY